MPYIPEELRQDLDCGGVRPSTSGELNYLITRLCLWFLGPAPRYEDFNDTIGALECAKQEFYRRAVVPYEEKKCAANGDIYAS